MAERGGLPWYQIWTDFPHHGKTLALCAALRDENAGMYVIRLWSHCADQALDGRIPAAIVESVAGWRRRRGVLLEALGAAGFVEPIEGGLVLVHGWDERNGSRIRKALSDAKKPRGNKSASRARPAPVHLGTESGPPGVDVRSETELEALSLAHVREGAEQPPAADPTGSRPPPAPTQGTEGTAGACTDPGPARVQPPSVPASTPDDLTPRERGALHRLGMTPPDERYPETAALLRELRARGWAEASWPKPEGRAGVEGLVRKVTVPVAADRLMALPSEERSSRWTLGWHVDAIAGKQRRQRAGDLGVVYGGRWWESLTPDEIERFRSERSALDPELDAAAPMPAVGALCPDAVQALIDRWRTRDARRHAGEDP